MSTDKNNTDVVIPGGERVDELIFELSEIVQRDAFRCRVENNDETIKEYAERLMEYREAVNSGKKNQYPFPQIKVWYDEEKDEFVLLGGYHRLEAARLAGLDEINAEVYYGSENMAFRIALKDNHGHGLQRTNGDLKLCLEKAAERFQGQSSGVIADLVGCSRSYASRICNQVSTSGHLPVPEKRKGRDGKEYPVQQNTANKKQKTDAAKKSDKSVVAYQQGEKVEAATEQVDVSLFENTLLPLTDNGNDGAVADKNRKITLEDAIFDTQDIFDGVEKSLSLEDRGEFLRVVGKWLKRYNGVYRADLEKKNQVKAE